MWSWLTTLVRGLFAGLIWRKAEASGESTRAAADVLATTENKLHVEQAVRAAGSRSS